MPMLCQLQEGIIRQRTECGFIDVV